MTDNLSKTKPERIERAIAKLIAQIASSPQSAEIYLIINNNQNRRQYNDDIRSK